MRVFCEFRCGEGRKFDDEGADGVEWWNRMSTRRMDCDSKWLGSGGSGTGVCGLGPKSMESAELLECQVNKEDNAMFWIVSEHVDCNGEGAKHLQRA